MTTAIVKAIAAVIGWFAARGIDALIGKWLAYTIIAFEQRASKAAQLAFSETIAIIKSDMPEKAAAWDAWRKRNAPPSTETERMV